MRDGWAGDIADFAKYGALKRLAGRDLGLGVVWYRTRLPVGPKPVTGYLDEPEPNRWSACDPDLFAALRRLVRSGGPVTLDALERCGALPRGTRFFGEPLDLSAFAPREVERRARARQAWLERALAATAGCDLVFFDPDTGLLPDDAAPPPTKDKGVEYAYHAEVGAFLARGQSVVVVQFGRPGNFEKEPLLARRRLAQLRERVGGCAPPSGLWWAARHKVGLLVAPHPRHARALGRRVDALLAGGGFGQLFAALEPATSRGQSPSAAAAGTGRR